MGDVNRDTVFAVVNGSGKVTSVNRIGLKGEGMVQGVVKEKALLRIVR